jgi:hypothetical protein
MTPSSGIDLAPRWLLATFFVVWCSIPSCARPRAPEVTGTWSGPMVLELDKGLNALVDIEVVLEQTDGRLRGRWHTLDSKEYSAAGDVIGTITRTAASQQVDLSFEFVGHHPGSPLSGAAQCAGVARASGQLTNNTTYGTSDRAVDESPGMHGWAIRLKAFDGFSFTSCPAIRYATWTLTRRVTPSPRLPG